MGSFLVIGPKGGLYNHTCDILDWNTISEILGDKVSKPQLSKVSFPIGRGELYPLAIYYGSEQNGKENTKAEEALCSVLNGTPLYGYVGLCSFDQNGFVPLDNSVAQGFAQLLGKEIESTDSDAGLKTLKAQRNDRGEVLTHCTITPNSAKILDIGALGFDENTYIWGGEIETIDVDGTPLEKEMQPIDKYPMGYMLPRLVLPVMIDLAKRKAAGEELPYSFVDTDLWTRAKMVTNKKVWGFQGDVLP